jgi:archaemetzincin
MKIGILPVGSVNSNVLAGLGAELAKVFPDSSCMVIRDGLTLDKRAYSKKRNQYRSSLILAEIKAYAEKSTAFDCVLGVVDVDIFAPELNYVFGEALTSGRAALVSMWRLKPEFCKQKADPKLLAQRLLKEAVHELGHTLGLLHCYQSACVMHFSNSIFDTDKKQSLFCDQCYLKAAVAISQVG